MEYMLLIVNREDAPPAESLGAAELDEFVRELGAQGILRGAAGPLRPVSEAARVRVRGGQALVTDGPFGEPREALGGCFAIEVADRAAAIEVAKRCPRARAGVVEVRAARYRRGGEASGARQFLLLYLLERGAPVPGEERIRQGMAEMRAFTDELARAGRYLGDGALPPQLPAARVETRDGKTIVLDGPFAESKEVIAGFALTEAANRAEAIAIAKRVPHAAWGEVEVREVGRAAPRN